MFSFYNSILLLLILVLTFSTASGLVDDEHADVIASESASHAEVQEDGGGLDNVTHVDGFSYNNSGSFNASLPDEYQPLLIGTTDRSGAHGDHEGGVDEQEHKGTGLEHEECELVVASFDWANVQNPMIIATFLFFSALTKISFHHAGFLVTKIPESCLLIVLGTICGTIFTFATDAETFPEDLKTLRPELFFMVLLPPIVLEASYSLHDRVFFDNLGSILVFAVIGTVTSCFFIGPSLYGLSYAGALPGGDKISFIHCMLFASIIVAVDPVAVLAIFQEIGVNSVLYFLVFGESLLNDAVTVVLYHTVEGMNCFLEEGHSISMMMYVTALLKFFATSFGGILIGIIYGALTSVLTKYTVETRVVEPLILFSMAYLSYVSSELFHFSGIVGITMCGLLQAQYAFHNISHKSYVTVKYFTKMASNASDSVIFLYLGLNLVRLDHEWHTGFIVASVLLTLIGRFIITYGLSRIVNSLRLRQISNREQFIMAYGGLRGAVAFSLVSMLTGKLDQKIQSMFMTTTLIVIIFTVFVQGGTIKPLVGLLDIRKQNKEEKLLLFTELNANVTDHLMAGIEEIVGRHGQNFIYDWLIHLDDKYIKHKLQRNPMRKDEKIMKLYEKIALKQHFANLKGTEAAEKYIKKSISAIEEIQLREGSAASVHPAVAGSAVRQQRASLLSQLTRYGDIEEPEQIDDIAYVTPDMLDDEEQTSISRKKFIRQQSVIADDLKNPQQFRLLLTQPGSSMDARELRSATDMDDRSNLMAQLQEKNKRLERFKRSVSNVMPDNSLYSVVASTMAPIPEGRGGQIVRKIGVGRQGSMMLSTPMRRYTDVTEYRAVRQARQKAANAAAAAADSEQQHQQASAKSVSCVGLHDTESRFVMGPKSRRGVFSARPSTASQIYDTANIPTAPTNTPISPTPVGATSNMSFSMATRIPKDLEKQKRLQRLHSMKNLEDEEMASADKSPQPSENNNQLTVRTPDKTPDDKNNSNSNHVVGQNNNHNYSSPADDSVFLRQNTEDIEMKPVSQEKLVHLQPTQQRQEDIEKGKPADWPLAQSSQDSDWFRPLPTVHELSEISSHPSDASLPRVESQRGLPFSSSSPRDVRGVELSGDERGEEGEESEDEDESETWDPEKEALVKRSNFRDKDNKGNGT